MKRLFWYIGKSSTDSHGKISSSRLSSYFILFGIILLCFVFMGIEIGNAILAWNKNEAYIVPFAHITIFGMILAHHLVLLGLKNANDKSVNAIPQTNIPKSETPDANKKQIIDNPTPDNPDLDEESPD